MIENGRCDFKELMVLTHDSNIHPGTTNTTDSSSNDKGIHRRSSTANSRSKFEEEDAEDIRPLSVELSKDFTPNKIRGRCTDEESNGKPCEFSNRVEMRNDDRLDIRDDSVIQCKKEGRTQNCQDDDGPLPAVDISRRLLLFDDFGLLFIIGLVD